jgi:hypothetical protein
LLLCTLKLFSLGASAGRLSEEFRTRITLGLLGFVGERLGLACAKRSVAPLSSSCR